MQFLQSCHTVSADEWVGYMGVDGDTVGNTGVDALGSGTNDFFNGREIFYRNMGTYYYFVIEEVLKLVVLLQLEKYQKKNHIRVEYYTPTHQIMGLCLELGRP